MTACITCVFSILFISSLILAGETQANFYGLKDTNQTVNLRNRTNTSLKKPLIHPDSQEFEILDPNFLVNRSYEIRKSRSKKKRQAAHGTKTSHQKHHRSSNKQNKLKSNLHHGDNSDVKIYETFEEIHEHINEPDENDTQFELSNRSEHEHDHEQEHKHEHDKSTGKIESAEEEKENKHVKIKVKHHHHHHHHNHIKEVVKSVPKPYPVEKIVHIPIEKIVEKIVHVPKFVNVTVEKIIHVPVEKIVEKIIRVPKPVHIPKPYMIEKIMEKIIHVPKPYPVLKTVPYPVEIKVPVPYEKKIPVPYTVEVERKVPVYISSQEPYKYEHTYSSPYTEKHMPKFASETEETSHFPTYYSEKYNFNKPNPIRQSYIEPTENYSFNKPIPFKHTEIPRTTEYQTNVEPAENYNLFDFVKELRSQSFPE
ncbi:uncharacterized protein LOC116805708 [Drosophila grimshawi]|uniref:uncharacterized protein LOC116805708 n=1 Tax=Drosophila grimshawi TaxID=7222 RepID=UPI0013EF4BF9|nr:uncharacterized protein LOC116805708 [Drosophila grimshawi]